jgi:hypothetical protein
MVAVESDRRSRAIMFCRVENRRRLACNTHRNRARRPGRAVGAKGLRLGHRHSLRGRSQGQLRLNGVLPGADLAASIPARQRRKPAA